MVHQVPQGTKKGMGRIRSRFEDVVEGRRIATDGPPAHGIPDVTFEGFDVSSEVFCCFFV